MRRNPAGNLTLPPALHGLCAYGSTLLLLSLLIISGWQFVMDNPADLNDGPTADSPFPAPTEAIGFVPFLQQERHQGKDLSRFGVTQYVDAAGIVHYRFSAKDGAAVTFTEAMFELENSDGTAFRTLLTQLLVAAASRKETGGAIFWECVPVSGTTAASTPFEFIANPAPELAAATAAGGEPYAFSDYILPSEERNGQSPTNAGNRCTDKKLVATFKNLGGDATLVAPCPISGEYGAYAHLGAFLRDAPVEQVHAFWINIGHTAMNYISDSSHSKAPFWMSTSGMGVYWLHVRFDSRPKYYTHAPFRVWA